MKKDEASNYTQDFIEYQNKQFLPGYYTGGKFLPALKYPSRGMGYLLFILGLGTLSITTMTGNLTLMNLNSSDIISNLVPLILGLILIVGGLNILRKVKKK